MVPKVSIIVPVYNVELYLHQCIDSILKQTLPDFELILINDGSTDSSIKICDYYAQIDRRIKVISKKNEGPSSARNLGIKIAKGNYIGFVDSDDTIDPTMYEKMFKSVLKHKSEIAACGYAEVNNFNGTTAKFTTPLKGNIVMSGPEIKRTLEELLSKNKVLGYASLCNKLFKREFITNNRLLINEEIKIAEDLCFNIQALSKAQKISSVNEPLYIYRRINSESIMNKRVGSFYLHLEARKELLNTLKINNISYEVYSKVLAYENSKTISDYIGHIKHTVYSNDKSLKKKYMYIRKLVHEQYLLDSLKNYDLKILVNKARIIILFLKVYLYFVKLLFPPKKTT